jgi:hypothetical protein
MPGRQRLALRTLAELDDQIAKAQTARQAPSMRCLHDDLLGCLNFASVVAARLAGQPLHQAHPHQPLHTVPDARVKPADPRSERGACS